jgi:alkaline phosphatase
MFTLKKHSIHIIILLLVVALVTGLWSATPAAAKSKAPKYIIVMISDGWGYNQVASASYYRYGEAGGQVYTDFPVQFAMSTFEVEKPVDNCIPSTGGYDPLLAWSNFNYVKYPCATDSASAATAMSTGVKTYNGYINVDVNGVVLWNIMQEAEVKGRSTGVVTSVELSHATPAGFVAHNPSRNNYLAIANEMIYLSATDVIMGAGNPEFDDNGLSATKDPRYVGGAITWAELKNGAAGNDADGDGDFDAWTLIQTRQAFQAMASGNTPQRVIGVPQVYTTLQQARAGDNKADPYVVPLTQSVPTLVEMTQGALNVLDNDPDGFVLMVEGGAVDWAGHANQSGRLIEEQIDFDNTVQAVVNWVQANSNWGETLLIVTGDHETGYLTGPTPDPANPTWMPVVNNGAGVLPGMQWNFGEHTNQLIPFFAKGDDGRWFGIYARQLDPVRGRYFDNTDIAKVIFQLLQGR